MQPRGGALTFEEAHRVNACTAHFSPTLNQGIPNYPIPLTKRQSVGSVSTLARPERWHTSWRKAQLAALAFVFPKRAATEAAPRHES
jgi:hypothetical protein